MKTGMIIMIMGVLLIFTGCVNKNEKAENGAKKQQITENEVVEIKVSAVENIKNWKNPVKEFLENRAFKITKAEISEDKEYTVFYLEELDESYFTNRKFLKRAAEVNGYKDFKIVAGEHYADVKCDKIKEVVKGVNTDFAIIEFKESEKKKEKEVKESSVDKNSKKEDKKLSESQQKAIEIAEKFAKKHLKGCGYADGITNMSVDSEDGDEIVLKVWNKGSTNSETIDWLIVNVKSSKVISENFNN